MPHLEGAFYGVESLNVEAYDALTALATTERDAFAAVPGAVTADVAFYLDVARRTGGPVLDLGCGTGRVAWAFAEAGFDVVGVDRSEPMLRRAEAKRAEHSRDVGARVRFVAQDMADLDLGREFGAAFVPYRSFQFLLTSDAQRRCLGRVRRHLRRDGAFVLDLFDPRLDWCHPASGVPETERERSVVTIPGTSRRVRIGTDARTNDQVAQVLTETWRFTEIDASGRTVRDETETLRLRWTYRHEARHLLALEGFEVLEEHSDFRRSPPAYGREIVLVARPAEGGGGPRPAPPSSPPGGTSAGVAGRG